MAKLRIFGSVWHSQVWFGFILNGMVHEYCLDVVPCKNSSSWIEKQLSYGQFKDIWFGLAWLGLIWFGLALIGIVYGYCLDVVPCKIPSSWLEKQQTALFSMRIRKDGTDRQHKDGKYGQFVYHYFNVKSISQRSTNT